MKTVKLLRIGLSMTLLAVLNATSGAREAGAGEDMSPPLTSAQVAGPVRRVNAPRFGSEVDWGQMAIFWFGYNEQGDPPTRNYADVRVGYNDDALEIVVSVADYYLWYDQDATADSDLAQYDAVSIYVDTAQDRSAVPQADDYAFLVGALHWQDVAPYMRQARGTGGSWNTSWVPSVDWIADAWMSWSDGGPNSNSGGIDYGWTAAYVVPWATLGLSGPPASGTVWGLGVYLYDRDQGPPADPATPQSWPTGLGADAPSTWGELAFNPPTYETPSAVAAGTTAIRRASEADTSVVQDAWVGGGGWCSGGHEGGADTNHGGLSPDGSVEERELYVGSETAVTHLPCFSKSFLRFYLDSIPRDKVILSAELTLHHWGNSGEPSAPLDEDRPHDSYVWLYNIEEDWGETSITWNNAPLAGQNMDMVHVRPLSSFAGWPGVPYTWDATAAVAAAYAAGQPVSLALYDSASERNTAKYLTSSETGDWNAVGRPTLTVTWGVPVAALAKEAQPSTAASGTAVTYTLHWLGVGQPLTVADALPAGVGAPVAIDASSGSATYDAGARQIVWTGAPTSGQAVTLTYSVTVHGRGPMVLRNTAVLVVEGGEARTASATVIVDPITVYLPNVYE